MATRDSEINVVVRGRDELTPELKKIESSIIRAVGAISAALAGIKIGTAPIIAAAAFERELANVAKTTDFTVAQMGQLSKALLDMSLTVDVAAVDLAKIAAAAGQQGLGKQGVAGVIQFTQSVSRMASVLDITAEEAAVNVGKIANVFKVPLSEIEKAVSVINEVSNNSTANGKELLDVVKRIGDAAGALNLQQTTALAATGLDFGISPEVVGTAISRVFSAAFEKADEFGAVMKISATEWTKSLQTDGLAAFQRFLAALRTLDTQSQQKAIVKLVGGGRIGALLNKLVQDTTDSVLTKNFKAAEDGLAGISAIKEQAKVLDTLDAKTRILGNAFIKLGVDSAEQLLGPLKDYADQLTEALETPGVKSFVNAAVKAIGELITVIADAIKFVASLNVNWENFLKVLQAFVALKLFTTFTSILGSLKLFGVELRAIGTDATKAATGLDKLAASGKKAGKAGDEIDFKATRRSQILGYEELSVAHQRRMAQLDKEKKAEQAFVDASRDLEKARAAAAPITSASNKATAVAAGVDNRATSAKKALDAQQAVVIATERKAQELREAEQKRFNDRLAANEQASKTRLQGIEKAHAERIASIQRAARAVQQAEAAALAAEQRVQAIAATPGFSRDRLAGRVAAEQAAAADARLVAAKNALAAEQAASIAAYNKAQADQTRFHAAAIANITKYHTARIAALEAAGSKEVAAEKAALAQRLAAYQAFAVAQKAAQDKAAAASIAAAAAGAATATAALRAEAAKTAAGIGVSTSGIIASFNRMSAAVTTAVAGIGLALRTLAGVATAVSRILFGAFFLVTMLYQVLDLTGALKALAPVIDSVGKFFGFATSKEREARLEAEQATAEWKRKEEALRSYTEAYRRALDTTGQNIDPKFIQQELEVFKITDDPERKKQALANVLGVIEGARAQQEKLQARTTDDLARETAEQEKILQKALSDRQRYAEQLARAQEASARAAPGSGSRANADQQVRANETFLAAANRAVEEATRKMEDFKEGTAATAREIGRLGDQQEAVLAQVGTLFSKELIPMVEQVSIPLAVAREEQARLTLELSNATKIAKAAGGDASALADELQRKLIQQSERVAGLTKALQSYKSALLATVGATPQQIAGAEFLLDFAQQELTVQKALVEVAKRRPEILLGNAGKPKPPASGAGQFTGKDKAGEARRIAKAELELARTRIQAENALADERAKQELENEEARYELGLTALQTYYDARERIKLAANARDIADKGLEIQAIDQSLKDPSIDKATEINFKAQKARLEGQVAVLIEQRNGISAEIRRERDAADVAFSERVTQETNNLFRAGVIPAEAQTVFKSNLDLMASQYRAFLTQLREQGNNALADALLAGFSVDAFVASIEPAGREISLMFQRIQQEQQRLSLARQDGSITSLEALKAYSDEIKRQLPLMEDQLRVMEEQLSVLARTAGTGSLAYREQAAAIDELILRIQRLGQETDATARQINEGFSASLEDALNRLEPTLESLKQTFVSFLLDIVNQIKAVFAKQIAESISQALGNVGTGGLGGVFQKLIDEILQKQAAEKVASLGELGINTDLVASGTRAVSKDAAAATAQTTAAQTAALTTTTAAQTAAQLLVAGATQAAAALTGAGGVTGLGELGINTALQSGAEVATEAPEAAAATAAATSLGAVALSGDLAAPALAALTVPTELLQVSFSSLLTPLLEMFGGFTSVAATAVQAAIALEALAAASTAQAATSFVGVFHKGGVVGKSPPARRLVNPAIFANAVRYHSGGVAGLKPNEVPTILEKGEHVLTAQQAAAQKTANNAGMGSIRNILVTDPNFVPDAMATSEGEKVLVTFIRKNKASIRQMLGA